MIATQHQKPDLRYWYYAVLILCLALIAVPITHYGVSIGERRIDSAVGREPFPPQSLRVAAFCCCMFMAVLMFVVQVGLLGVAYARADLRQTYSWFRRSWLGVYWGLLIVTIAIVCAAYAGNYFESIPMTVVFGIGAGLAGVYLIHSILAASVSLPILLYKLWQQVQDGNARATPARAVGFLFVPIFNLYWVFVAFPGLADELNRCATRRSLMVEPARRRLMVVYCILCFVVLIPYLGILAAIVNVGVGYSALRSASQVALALSKSQENGN